MIAASRGATPSGCWTASASARSARMCCARCRARRSLPTSSTRHRPGNRLLRGRAAAAAGRRAAHPCAADRRGLTAKVSSIHVNAWFGTHDKLSMTRRLMREQFGVDLDAEREGFAFIGDSPTTNRCSRTSQLLRRGQHRAVRRCAGPPPAHVIAEGKRATALPSSRSACSRRAARAPDRGQRRATAGPTRRLTAVNAACIPPHRMQSMARIGVIGGGAFGTAMACVLRRSGTKSRCGARARGRRRGQREARERGLPARRDAARGHRRHGGHAVVAREAEFVLLVPPAQHMRAAHFIAAASPGSRNSGGQLLEGIERGSCALMSQVLADTLPQARIAILSGPSFAAEIAVDLPAGVTLACADPVLGRGWNSRSAARAFASTCPTT